MTSFQISGLPIEPFAPLFSLSDPELASRGMRHCIADSRPGYPCRVSLRDADIGESLILLSHEHHPVAGPYRAGGPIYIRLGAKAAVLRVNEVPEVVRGRLISIRAYDAQGELRSAGVAEGNAMEPLIHACFADESVAYLHLHNAKPGCYSCRVNRAG